MVRPSQVVSNFRDRYVGEPLSMDELEKRPHLHRLAKDIRDALQFTNKYLRDIDLQNKQDYENFMALFNNDLIFRLKVTQQYYLLQNLFKDPSERARWIKFLDEIRSEERDRNLNQQAAPTPIKANVANVSTNSLPNQTPFAWTQPDPKWSNSKKLKHYEDELQRITIEYHTQRVQVRNNSINRDTQQTTGYIDRMMRVLRPNIPEERQAIAELDAIKQEVLNKRQEIMNIRIHKPDGSVDLLATAQRQDEEMELLQRDYTTRIEAALNHVENNPALNALREERAEVLERDAGEIREIDRSFGEQKALLTAHIEQARRDVAKEEAVHQLGEIINAANLCDVDEPQKETLKNSVKKLEHYQKLLEKTEDWATVQTIMQGCKGELAQIKEIIPEIRPEIEALDKLVVEPIWMQSPPPAYDDTNVEPTWIQPPPPAYNEVGAEPQQTREPISATEERVVEMQQSETQDMATAQSRVDETENRSIPSAPPQEDLDAIRVDHARFREGVRSPEKQRKIALQDISSTIEDIVNDENADERLHALAVTLQTQIATIQGHANYQEVPDDIKKSFATTLEEFGLADEEFNDFKNKYAPMFEPSEPPPYQTNYNP